MLLYYRLKNHLKKIFKKIHDHKQKKKTVPRRSLNGIYKYYIYKINVYDN